jgi:hypothetical protein
MLLVVVVLAVLTGTLTVSLRGRADRHALRIAGSNLASAIRYAVAETKATHTPHRIAFRDNWSSYRVETARSASDDEFVPVAGMAGRTATLAGNVRIVDVSDDDAAADGLAEALWVHTDGSGFHGSVRLANRNDQTLTIVVSPVTGQVQVVE